jgi:hypothetical protein
VFDSIRPIRPTVAKRMLTLLVLPHRRRRWRWPPRRIFKELRRFLAILLYLFTPWTAINLVDFYVVRKGHYSVREIFNPRHVRTLELARPRGLRASAFAAMIPFFSTGIYSGPVARALGGADVAMLVSRACRWRWWGSAPTPSISAARPWPRPGCRPSCIAARHDSRGAAIPGVDVVHTGPEQHHGRELRREFRFSRDAPAHARRDGWYYRDDAGRGFRLGQLFLALPLAHQALKVVGTAYLIYLAWRIASASSVGAAARTAHPLSLLQGAAFQCVNVKAWIVAVSAITTYTVVDASLPLQVCEISALSAVMALASVAAWTLFGQWLRQFLNTAHRLRWFNYCMAVLLVASIIPTL